MRRRKAIIGAVSLLPEMAVLVQRRGRLIAANTVVRCRRGHLFTTIWIPGASLKAIRLGWWRFQRCPVGSHWTLVTPAKVADLTEEEKGLAAQQHDVRIP